MSKNSNLIKAKANKNDEFYTQYKDIENELKHYKYHFKDKIIYCNCDDPEWSNFWKYFKDNFNILGIKKLISTFINFNGSSIKTELELIDGNLIKTKTPLLQNGDFRSPECIEILKECDIVVTNPPFSLFREYVAQLIEYDKKFLIIGNVNSIICKDIFPLIKENKMWPIARKGDISMWFEPSADYESYGSQVKEDNGKRVIKVSGACWFSNLDHKKRHEKVILYKTYKGNESEYPKYINFDAINVNESKHIPKDYYGIMGVPISFLTKLCPDQFEIVGSTRHSDELRLDLNLENLKKVSKDGSEKKQSKLGKSPYLVSNIRPKKDYYICDNINGYITESYQRLLIKRIDLDDKEFYGLD